MIVIHCYCWPISSKSSIIFVQFFG